MITKDTTLAEIKQYPLLRRYYRYFAYDGTPDGSWTMGNPDDTLADLERKYVTWNAVDMAYGLNVFNAQEPDGLALPVYPQSEVGNDPEKADVLLFRFKANETCRLNKTCILAAGGAYGTVYSILESFPSAARLAELGLDVFCLNYRVGGTAPLFPKPMEDMAAAVRFLLDREEALHICMKDYAVGGFSAGGHLAACYGLKTLGYAAYGLPRPGALFLNYPMTAVLENVELFPEPARTVVLRCCLGDAASQELSDIYNPTLHADTGYPPCYIAQTKDDSTVPITFTEVFANALTALGVPVEFFKPEHGYHGYGLGTGGEAEGWPEQAAAFLARVTGTEL